MRNTTLLINRIIHDLNTYPFYVFFRYRNYEFISDNEISKSAGLGTRYTDKALRGIIMDIHFLSITDYLVCTFSSQVGYSSGLGSLESQIERGYISNLDTRIYHLNCSYHSISLHDNVLLELSMGTCTIKIPWD